MKREYKTAIRKLLLVFVVIILFAAIIWMIIPKHYSELTEGNFATDFCEEKCSGKDVYFSNNNSVYNFIRCECVEGVQRTYSPNLGGKDYPITKVMYFDSQTYQELNRTDVIKRIEG